jgi:hypothetical protein
LGKLTRALAFAAVGIVVVVVTLVVFFAGFGAQAQTGIGWWSLGFLLFSEVALFLSIILIGRGTGSPVIIRTGVVTTLSVYWALMVVSAFLSPLIFFGNLGAYIIVQVIIAAAALILTIAFAAIASSQKSKESMRRQDNAVLAGCEKLAFSLKSNEGYRAYAAVLNKLYEEIRYSDKTVSVEEEQQIASKLSDLEKLLKAKAPPASDVVSQRANDILLLIAQRNESVKRLKHAN